VKAIRVHQFGGPEVLRLEEVADLHPGPGQVLVRMKAAGVNPTDVYSRAGTLRRPALPYTPGVDGAGIVETVGEAVTGARVGERVYVTGSASGTYAEEALCDESQVHPLPEGMSYAQGAGIGIPYVAAYMALFQRARAAPGESVLVHGATGGVGLAATQMARAAGLEVIGTGGTEAGRNLVLEQGAHHVLDHRSPNYLDQLREFGHGDGVDIIIEMLANVNLEKDLKVLAQGGRIVIVGSRGRIEIDPRDAMVRDASIIGMLVFNSPQETISSIHAALRAGFEDGVLRPIVGEEIQLADAGRAHVKVMEPGAYGKIVLIP
jgi:NADPH2:quinone reductase